MSVKHTLGRWKAGETRYNRDLRTFVNVMTHDGLCFVAAVSCDPDTDTGQLHANARLIAAAPDFLAAAVEFCRKVDDGEACSKSSYAAFAAAIEKATVA